MLYSAKISIKIIHTMAIDDFLTATICEWSHNNYSVAMSSVCNAVDATAREEFSDGGNKNRYLKFLNKYLDIITEVGFGGAIFSRPGSTLNIPDPCDPNKTKNITSLPSNVEFTDRAFYGYENNIFKIPTRLIAALFLAVIASPINTGISISESWQLILDEKAVPINSLAGDASKVRQYLGL